MGGPKSAANKQVGVFVDVVVDAVALTQFEDNGAYNKFNSIYMFVQ